MAKVVLTVKIESELKERVASQSTAEYRTITDLTTQALLEYVERKEQQRGATNG